MSSAAISSETVFFSNTVSEEIAAGGSFLKNSNAKFCSHYIPKEHANVFSFIKPYFAALLHIIGGVSLILNNLIHCGII